MTTITIEVAKIDERMVKTRYGDKTAYDVFDTKGTKYSFGFKAPGFYGMEVGGKYTVEADISGKYMSIDPKLGVTRVDAGAVVAEAPPEAPKSGGRPRGVFPIEATSGEMAIIRQNALTNAVATCADFIATIQPDQWPDLEKWTDMVLKTAYKYAEFSSGHREVKAALGMVDSLALNTAMAPKTTKEEPKGDDEDEEDTEAKAA